MSAEKGAQLKLSELARAGFQDLGASRQLLIELSGQLSMSPQVALEVFAEAADPDAALARISFLIDSHPSIVLSLSVECFRRLVLLVGASAAFGDFFARHPEHLVEILQRGGRIIEPDHAHAQMLHAVRCCHRANRQCGEQEVQVDAEPGSNGWEALRIAYRELLAELMLYDLEQGVQGCATQVFEAVAASLSVLAAAAIEASLVVARATLLSGLSGPPVPLEVLAAVRLGIVAMGKCGAEELNVVSDVDVMFVAESADPAVIDGDALIRLSSRLASETMRGIHDPCVEPGLWQLDANLRPEGRHGALVRTLGSMLSYYERWAKAWEFQALVKARPLAGDLALAEEFVRRTRALVWASASRDDFVGSVQRMRARVTERIAEDEREVQLKLGPGGLRDIEFSVQLLQLVHGQYDERLQLRGTLPALLALVEGGYIARGDGECLSEDYRRLRVLEHRLQLRELRRTALMPRDDEALRVLSRSSGLAENAQSLVDLWERTKLEVRELHLKIFYAPLLSAVAALPEDEFVLGSDEARARLSGIGFGDPEGAMRHLVALTRGTSRRARIQRNLMPVLLHWLAEGTDPDFGLLAFRRVSEANSATPWYLRLLRDGTDAAQRLMRVLSSSRFIAQLLETIPEAVGWLERDELLRPLSVETLRDEMRALASRREGAEDAAVALRAVHRREVLRLAMGRTVGVIDDAEVAFGLDAAHTALLDGLLMAVRRFSGEEDIEIALIGLGRFGGRELVFASDIDLVAVLRAPEGVPSDQASKVGVRVIAQLRQLVSDPRFPVDLDFDLRPEGKNGPLARSLDAYRSYYSRWSLTWETQALLRARYVAGDARLGADFIEMADAFRYPPVFDDDQVREVRRMKARVEAERLPQGAEPKRHLKLGPGGVSDVEWLVQLIQLREGARHPELRTVSTLEALDAAVGLGLLDVQDAWQLRDSWCFAGVMRTALKLWSGKVSDSLPRNRDELEGINGVLGVAAGRTGELEERWFGVSRRARVVFERCFYGYVDDGQLGR